MSAIELNARASSNFPEKLAETQALLQRAAKASAEAKVKTVGYAGGILYAGNKIHNKINEMRDASNQQDQQYYYQ